MEKNNIPEEVTITPVIRDIERLILRLFWAIGSVFKWLGKGIGALLTFALKHFLIIAIAAVIGGFLGYLSMSYFPQSYESNLIVSMKVDASAQFHADIIYFNSLIEKEEIEKLMALFHISKEEAISLQSFTTTPYSTHMRRIEKLNKMYEGQDTNQVYMLDLEQMVESSDPYLFSEFIITVKSSSPTVFSKLEESILARFEADKSLQEKLQKKRNVINLQIKTIEGELESLDSLKSIYNTVLLEHAKTSAKNQGQTTINLSQAEHGSWMNPLNVYHVYEKYTEKLFELEEEVQQLSSCFTIEAHFSEYGQKTGMGTLSRALSGAGILISLALLILFGIDQRKRTTS